jgi:phenylacetate-CoA ligase
MLHIPRSAASHITWPALPQPDGAVLLAIMRQLDESQWLPAAELEELQFRTLAVGLRHACDTVPYYRDRAAYREVLDSPPIDARAWRRLPFLRRSDVQDAGDGMLSDAVPADHLPLTYGFTSGSSGRPVRAVWTEASKILGLALALREHEWYGYDSNLKLASIRFGGKDGVPPEGRSDVGWGPAIDPVYPLGRSVILGISNDLPRQAEWLIAENPDYLRSQPSAILALARHFLDTGARLDRLRAVATFGETLTPEARVACREAWGVEIHDIYGGMELGLLALQCPDGQGLHVLSEGVYLEVLGDDDEPCRPGEVGRVVISSLHNYGMPWIRYENGDLAEVGEPCPCGRGLPVLARVVGRQKNMLRLPTGKATPPFFPARAWIHVAPIRKLQLIQDELDHIEARILAARPLTGAEESELIEILQRLLGYPFRFTMTHLERDDDTGPKFEEFISRL